MKTVRLALLGYGNAGRAFGRMLERKKADIRRLYDAEVVITALVTGSRGSLFQPEGLDVAAAEADLAKNGRFTDDSGMDAMAVIQSGAYDVLVELTPISIRDGQPAITHIETALNLGKDVITANKGPIAWAWRRLTDLAAAKGCKFYYETTVMDGTPVFNLASETLRLCTITEVDGILNATTNYILGELEKGVSFEDAVKTGREKGFVEADPSMDIDGWDAAAKLTALMNVLMNAGLTPNDIDRTGIRDVTAAEVQAARARGMAVKLVCRGWLENGVPKGKVAPAEVPMDDAMATITGAASIVGLTTDLAGKISVIEYEHKPEIDQTAYGILSDLARILAG
ncbi:hypothetical protein LJC60_05060 [Ruminococcaceae bacterium OttesenSCG-928-D13]|nr:hypothetical protein [Ruminococcaceae bacterium OttesenSCG-928-D13]